MAVLTIFFACLLFVLTNSEESYKMESPNLEKTPNYTGKVSNNLFVRKRVFDIIPTNKLKTQMRNKFLEIDGEISMRKNKAGVHGRVFLIKMFMRQRKMQK